MKPKSTKAIQLDLAAYHEESEFESSDMDEFSANYMQTGTAETFSKKTCAKVSGTQEKGSLKKSMKTHGKGVLEKKKRNFPKPSGTYLNMKSLKVASMEQRGFKKMLVSASDSAAMGNDGENIFRHVKKPVGGKNATVARAVPCGKLGVVKNKKIVLDLAPMDHGIIMPRNSVQIGDNIYVDWGNDDGEKFISICRIVGDHVDENSMIDLDIKYLANLKNAVDLAYESYIEGYL